MKLSPRQIELVRTTFALLEPKARVAALAYFQRLFTLNPALRSQLGADLDAESDQLMALLREATDCADQPKRLQTLMTAPHRCCASFDVGGAHHGETGEALLWSLGTTLGHEFTPEARVAWAQLHAALGETRARPLR